MITADGFFDWMRRDLGPADKTYSDPCTSEIVVFHDAVGYYAGWMSRLKSTARDAQGRYTAYAAASVTGWLPYRAGEVPVQHFSIFKSCWASGSRFLNTRGNAFENESAPIYTLPSGAWAFVGSKGPGDWHSPPPQSDWQVACAARIEADIAAFKGWPLTYWRRPTSAADVTATEYEHNETTRWGGLYSSCPNGRIRWDDIAALRQEEDMSIFDKTIAEVLPSNHPFRVRFPTRDNSIVGAEIINILGYLDAEHLGKILGKLDGISIGGIDYAALAKAVNDDAARRLKD